MEAQIRAAALENYFDIARQLKLETLPILQLAGVNRAMFMDPGNKGHVVKRGDFLGKAEIVRVGGANGTEYQVNWRVDRVRDGDVVLSREDPAQPQIPAATRVIPLHPEGEDKTKLLEE